MRNFINGDKEKMVKDRPLAKVISLNKKLAHRESATFLHRNGRSGTGRRLIAVTSGKGGVGKTNIVANLGYVLSMLGREVLILDGDLGLGNLDVLLGLAPKYNISHVIMGQKTIPEITLEGPGRMKILPASSGVQELTQLTEDQKSRILSELDKMANLADIFLIDTPAGISTNVTYFNLAAQEIIVVVSPEPTSITDAYALMKILSIRYQQKNFLLLVNMVSDNEEGLEVYNQIDKVSKKFLDISLEYFGFIVFDKNVIKCVKKQKIISQAYPDSQATKCFESLGKRLCSDI